MDVIPVNYYPTDALDYAFSTITVSAPGFTGKLQVGYRLVRISDAGPTGSYVVTVNATDNCGVSTSSSFRLNVIPVPQGSCQKPFSGKPVDLGAGKFLARAADFNNDDYKDLAVVDSFGNFSILLNNGAGDFRQAPGVPFRVETGNDFAAADFNSDGQSDLAVMDSDNSRIMMLSGDGKGGLSSGPITSLSSEGDFYQMLPLDLNRDQKPDLIAFSSKILILLNDGTGRFISAPNSPVMAGYLCHGDFNGDGKEDLVTIVSDRIVVMLNKGDGDFAQAPDGAFIPPFLGSAVAGDFNGDQKTDLAVRRIDRIYTLFGDGYGGFTSVVESLIGTFRFLVFNSMVARDLNGDGRTDLVVDSGNISSLVVLMGDGNGRFTPAPGTPLTPYNPQSIIVEDFNSDNRPDLVIAQFTSRLVMWFNDCPCVAPQITVNPVNQATVAGGNVTFNAAATEWSGLKTQWQVSVDGGQTFADISGATSNTLVLSSVTFLQSGNRYRAVFTNSCGVSVSNAAILTVTSLPPSEAVTVNTSSDTVANDGFCSLREAIIAANTNTASGALAGECAAGRAGQDTIQFSLGSGTPGIAVTGSSLPDITEPVQILGNTGGATRIELNGTGAGANADGLSITAGNSLIRSLVINRFSGNGIRISSAGGNIITGCYIGVDVSGATALPNQTHGIYLDRAPGNIIGGDEAGARNVISGNTGRGIEVRSPDNRILGNYIGTNAAGNAALPNGATGIILYFQNNIVGGTTAASRNLISGNKTNGITLFGQFATGNLVAGNYIGTNADGAAAIPNGFGGIDIVLGAANNIIGGIEAGARNLISGNEVHEELGLGNGIFFDNAGSGNRVQGNYIGTNKDGSSAIPNKGFGIYSFASSGNLIGGTEVGARNLISGNLFSGVGLQVGSGNRVEGNYIGTNADGTAGIANGGGVLVGLEASNNSIGGLAPGAGNLIAFNQFDGVLVIDFDDEFPSFNVPVLSNSIHSNGGLGIDLSPPVESNGSIFSVVTPNDAGDGDAGPNHLQNFPVLSSAVVAGNQLAITGSLNSEANRTYLIQFFACAACGAASQAEGQTLIGQTTVTTDGSGNAAFSPSFPVVVPDGRIITATATLVNGDAAERQENASTDTPTDTSEFAAGIAACVAPTITQQPVSRTLQAGSAVSFSVTAEGTGPLTYQWRKDGVNIQGATDSAYNIPIIAATSAGKYDVIVTGACGDVTSAQAMLTVTRAATTTTVASAPNPSLPGTSVSLTAMVSSTVTALGAPTGTVTFSDGNNVLGTVPLNGGKAIFTTSALVPGAHQLRAEYNDDPNFNGSSGNLVHRVLSPEDILTVRLTDPFACTSEGSVLSVTAQVINPAATALPFEFRAMMPPELIALESNCKTTSGNCAVSPGEVRVSGQIGANQSITISYKVQVRDDTQAVADFCIASTAGFDTDGNGSFELSVRINECERIDCPNTDPGVRATTESPLSDQKAGSVLVFNFYTLSANNPTIQNTRINLTNTDQARTVSVHLFFVDGSDCSVADSVLCLSQNQTASLLASDIDPGVTGYLIAVAVDGATGCPISFNRLMGDAYIKLPGWQTNLSAVAISALSGAPLACDAGSSTATLNFDGVSYNRIPRTLAVSNLASPLDGNAPLLILNRIGGSLTTGLSRLEAVFGILFDDAEHPFSFSFNGGCQFRSVLNNNFPRTTPRLNSVIPVGHTGWMKLWTTEDAGMLGAIINANPQAATNQNAFGHGHNLHALTFTSNASLTMPVHPPGCN